MVKFYKGEIVIFLTMENKIDLMACIFLYTIFTNYKMKDKSI